MWRLRYRDSLHPEGVWTLQWFQTKADAEDAWKSVIKIEESEYEVRHVTWPPRRAYNECGETDEMITMLHFMNRWASSSYL